MAPWVCVREPAMPLMCCPRCRSTWEAPAVPPGQFIACAHCHATVSMPPTDHIQVPDMRLDAPMPVTQEAAEAIKEPATDVPTVKTVPPASDEGPARSPALRREMERFADSHLPDLHSFGVLPTPGDLADEVDELGAPIASLHLPADGRVDVMIGWTILVVSSAAAVGILIAATSEPRNGDGLAQGGMLAVIFALSGGAILWGRKRAPARTLWVCPDGLIWEYGKRLGFCRWDEVHEFSLSAGVGRPIIWLSPVHGTQFVLWGSRGPSIVPIADYIELKTAAARLQAYLERIGAGERLEFGKISMDRAGIYWRADRCKWADVASVHLDGSYFVVNHVRHRARFHLPSREVSFPAVAQAVARIVTEEGLPART